ncbi:hypothetical protein MM221_04275 [Salipaludibacillus sp. LMS25]|uniref:hypothetical protein n=1 Tax=Salipaludibacillus sp. LMS25 TaxID=2924031 RepID=UPI0020D11D89|nr:hypothetical protein [Salipaludibacillus sp. LMS25]UTR15802.1 hypothetical protein MM221_04275 [Salipaludibacillus sp. LMS25]
MFFIFIIITSLSLLVTFRYRKTFCLAIPFLTIFIYFLIQVILVPASFIDTVKFIFSLR